MSTLVLKGSQSAAAIQHLSSVLQPVETLTQGHEGEEENVGGEREDRNQQNKTKRTAHPVEMMQASCTCNTKSRRHLGQCQGKWVSNSVSDSFRVPLVKEHSAHSPENISLARTSSGVNNNCSAPHVIFSLEISMGR